MRGSLDGGLVVAPDYSLDLPLSFHPAAFTPWSDMCDALLSDAYPLACKSALCFMRHGPVDLNWWICVRGSRLFCFEKPPGLVKEVAAQGGLDGWRIRFKSTPSVL